MAWAGRVIGLFQKPANLEDAKTPENKLVSKVLRSALCKPAFHMLFRKKWKMSSGSTPLHLSRWRKFENGTYAKRISRFKMKTDLSQRRRRRRNFEWNIGVCSQHAA
jgi:hypothetical protein